MRLLSAMIVVVSASAISAQSSQSGSAQPVPRLISVSGVFQPADGQPPAPVETITLSVYAEAEGGSPLWEETQTVALDSEGRYSLLLGATRPDGIPPEVFGGEAAHWLGTAFERAGEVEGPRTRLTSVPYAIRAADADTLGGRPASAYLLAPDAGGATSAVGATGAPAASVQEGGVTAQTVLPGTPNFLAKYVNGADVGSSGVFESADGSVGLGTTTPFDRLHVRYDNGNGQFTGLAVQNMNGGQFAYSGMLFYDHTNELTQFQGYNNFTHEYRINNIARVSPGGAYNGSINFMIGGSSKFYVSPISVGIGTTLPSPTSNLDVSNAVSGSGTTNVNVTTYSANAFGPALIGKKARGTESSPTSVLNNDALLNLNAHGYGAGGFVNSAGISMRTSENWTPTAQGSIINFDTTANGTTVANTRMTIGPNGNVGIGVYSAQAGLEVSNSNNLSGAGTIFATTFTNAGTSLFVGRRARGTGIAPTAVLSGDNLVGYLAQGYGTSAFSGTRGGMFVQAAENWTNTAQGTSLNFNTTVTGTTTPGTRVTISPSGNLGIGTTNPGAPLQIVRDGQETTFIGTSFNDDDGSAVFFQRARGTLQAPASVLAGDALGYFGAGGYGATTFGDGVGAMAVIAAQNWTDTANGTTIAFATTPLGTTDFVPQAVILPNGFLGLGTPGDANGIPTATDRLQVFGDIRVGTSGTNGCIKDFGGNQIAGTCSSDRRFKKDITPFDRVLDRLTALQPVHYFWRASEFPDRQFGQRRAYGLIAQDVEQILPELVVTNDDGFKAVDYSGLPLLTIQAVKDLKSENDALQRRVAELERLVNDLLAASARR